MEHREHRATATRTEDHEQYTLYCWRTQMERDGHAVSWPNMGSVTVEQTRNAADAALCENPRLNAVALRWGM